MMGMHNIQGLFLIVFFSSKRKAQDKLFDGTGIRIRIEINIVLSKGKTEQAVQINCTMKME